MATYAIATGIAIHLFFKRREPTVYQFLSFTLCYGIAAYTYSVNNEGRALRHAVSFAVKMLGYFLGGLCSSIVVYRMSPWHPLANYPGPALAKLSKWWMAYWIGKGDRHTILQQLHAKHGPWLRVGPNEVSINIPQAVRPVYGHLFRAPFYQCAPQEADALITTLDLDEHASRLVAWNKAFATESLRKFRDMVEIRTEQLLDILHRESSQGKSIDFSKWISLWAMDNMGDISFSGGFETMASGRDTEGWMEVFAQGVMFIGVIGQVPWMRNVIAWFPPSGPIIKFREFVSEKVVASKVKSGEVKQDILGIIQDEASGGPPLSYQEASADASLMIGAGADTVSQAATTFFRYVAGDKVIQKRLRAEINGAFDVGDEFDSVKLAKLPYLDACVQEALRILPPIAAGPPRYSANGAPVLSRYVPAGTTIACPTYTLHHDPQNFKDPDMFKPERWLSGSTISPHVREAFIPFSYGLGVCVGKPVALHNMKLLAAKTLQSFELSFPKIFSAEKFDSSYKEHGIWFHDPLMLEMKTI